MDMVDSVDNLIPKHGGYRHLKSFQVAQVVYDVTVRFCERYIERGSRTRDQMVQAARSGVQNIAEGSMASGTSKKMELKLTNVARASLEELRLDYEDFLRQRGLALWERDDTRREKLIAQRPRSAEGVANWARQVKSMQSTKSTYAEIAANGVLALISAASSLLARQLASLEKAFVEKGGFTERLYRVRTNTRQQVR
jgi:four helix bundle suffix protein